jgi:hypothetical protein
MITIWYGVTSFIFGILLFFPVRKLLLSLNINRHQAKTNKSITPEELEALKKKINIIAAILSMSFAFFYNKFMIVKYFQP